jgi:hypothetical protein
MEHDWEHFDPEQENQDRAQHASLTAVLSTAPLTREVAIHFRRSDSNPDVPPNLVIGLRAAMQRRGSDLSALSGDLQFPYFGANRLAMLFQALALERTKAEKALTSNFYYVATPAEELQLNENDRAIEIDQNWLYVADLQPGDEIFLLHPNGAHLRHSRETEARKLIAFRVTPSRVEQMDAAALGRTRENELYPAMRAKATRLEDSGWAGREQSILEEWLQVNGWDLARPDAVTAFCLALLVDAGATLNDLTAQGGDPAAAEFARRSGLLEGKMCRPAGTDARLGLVHAALAGAGAANGLEPIEGVAKQLLLAWQLEHNGFGKKLRPLIVWVSEIPSDLAPKNMLEVQEYVKLSERIDKEEYLRLHVSELNFDDLDLFAGETRSIIPFTKVLGALGKLKQIIEDWDSDDLWNSETEASPAEEDSEKRRLRTDLEYKLEAIVKLGEPHKTKAENISSKLEKATWGLLKKIHQILIYHYPSVGSVEDVRRRRKIGEVAVQLDLPISGYWAKRASDLAVPALNGRKGEPWPEQVIQAAMKCLINDDAKDDVLASSVQNLIALQFHKQMQNVLDAADGDAVKQLELQKRMRYWPRDAQATLCAFGIFETVP